MSRLPFKPGGGEYVPFPTQNQGSRLDFLSHTYSSNFPVMRKGTVTGLSDICAARGDWKTAEEFSSPESSPELGMGKSEMPYNFKCSPGAVESPNLIDKLDNVISCHPCPSHITHLSPRSPRDLPSPKLTSSNQYSVPDGVAKYLTFSCSLLSKAHWALYIQLCRSTRRCTSRFRADDDFQKVPLYKIDPSSLGSSLYPIDYCLCLLWI